MGRHSLNMPLYTRDSVNVLHHVMGHQTIDSSSLVLAYSDLQGFSLIFPPTSSVNCLITHARD